VHFGLSDRDGFACFKTKPTDFGVLCPSLSSRTKDSMRSYISNALYIRFQSEEIDR